MKNQTCCCKLKKKATSKLIFKEGDLYYCGETECREKIEKEIKENKERSMYQGRTYEQYRISANIAYYATLGIIGLMLGYFLFILVSSL